MAPKKVRCNFRIIVTPRIAGDYGFAVIHSHTRTDAEELKLCREIEAEIKRHVDNVGETHVEWDEYEECSFCGEAYRLIGDYIPNCCEAAIREAREQRGGML